MDLAEERRIIDRCRHDPGEFGPVYDANVDAVFGYVLHRVGDVAMAQDLTAEVFLRATTKLWQFRWQGVSISNWLFRLATNEVNGYFRRRRRDPVATAVDGVRLDSLRSPRDELAAASAAVAAHERFEVLRLAVARLPARDQTAVALRFFEKKSFADVASVLGTREGTARMRVSRALDRLRQILRKEGITHAGLGERTGTDASADARCVGFSSELEEPVA